MTIKPAIAVGAVVVALAASGVCGCSSHGHEGAQKPTSRATANANQAANANQVKTPANEEQELAERLREICDRAGGTVGVAVIHVESGRSVSVQGTTPLPLYSVFKLPLAVAVLKDVEENRLQLDKKVSIAPEEVAPGWRGNTDLWRNPVDRTVAQLLELSILRSDNTSSDKLLQLVGGPAAVTQRMRSLGLGTIDILYSTREFAAQREKPNTGSADDLAHLLALLQKGQVLQPPQLTLLLGLMERAATGLRRLRADLPANTPVADKTGTGDAGSATNDVGLITLPKGNGHLAMVVFVSGSKLPAETQEKLIAQLARVAYDAHVSRTAPQ